MRHRSSRGSYFIGDQTPWSAPGGGPGALAAFAQLGVGGARVQTVAGYASAGVTRLAPLAARADDAVGAAVTTAFLGSHARRAAGPGALGPAEAGLELTYAAQLTSWLAAQADAQYVAPPGGARAVRSAWVPGVRVVANRSF